MTVTEKVAAHLNQRDEGMALLRTIKKNRVLIRREADRNGDVV